MVAKSNLRNVLVVRFSALGDVAIAIPVVYSVCMTYPDTRFIMVTRQWSSQLFIERPSNLVVLGVDVTNEYSGAWGMIRLARKLRKEYQIDAVADLHSVLRSWVIDATLRLCGKRVVRINKGRCEKRQLIKGKLRHPIDTTNQRYTEVFYRLGLVFDEIFEGFFPSPTAVLPAKTADEKWVAVAPFSQHRGKEYPLEKMEEVIASLVEREDVRVILFGGGNKEKKLLAGVAQRHARTISLAGIKHGFTDEYAVLRQCDVMVSMDSANMHLASLTSTPVVSVWGSTHPWCGFMGWCQASSNAVQLDLPCRPCSVYGEKDCRYGDYHCLGDLPPQLIVERVEALLQCPPQSP